MIHDVVSCEHILHWTLYSRARKFPKTKEEFINQRNICRTWLSDEPPLMLLRNTVLINFLFYLPGIMVWTPSFIFPIEYLISIWDNYFWRASSLIRLDINTYYFHSFLQAFNRKNNMPSRVFKKRTDTQTIWAGIRYLYCVLYCLYTICNILIC